MGANSRETPKELLNDVRAGNLDAAYELLGRQAHVTAWKQALDALARHPEQADVELAAHRALRRPQEVVSGLLDLMAAVQTSKAAHVAHAVARLRDEEHLVDRAVEVRDHILESVDLETILALGNEMDRCIWCSVALYRTSGMSWLSCRPTRTRAS